MAFLPPIRVDARAKRLRIEALGRASDQLGAIIGVLREQKKQVDKAKAAILGGADPFSYDVPTLTSPPSLVGARLVWTRARRQRGE